MLELFQAGGLLMWPLLLCSVLSMAITIERFWSLRSSRIAPGNLVALVWQWERSGHLDGPRLQTLRDNSPLGRILAAGLTNRNFRREVMKEHMQDVGRHVSHDLRRFLNTLGTIAQVTPLLGLLGTVIGMIKVFAVITVQGIGNPGDLAEGISEALITTAAGLSVGIPTQMFYRYFRGKVETLVITMEREALKLVDVMQGRHREGRVAPRARRPRAAPRESAA